MQLNDIIFYTKFDVNNIHQLIMLLPEHQYIPFRQHAA